MDLSTSLILTSLNSIAFSSCAFLNTSSPRFDLATIIEVPILSFFMILGSHASPTDMSANTFM